MTIRKNNKKLLYFSILTIIIGLIIYDVWCRMSLLVESPKGMIVSNLMEEIIGMPEVSMFIGTYKQLNITGEEWNKPICEPMYYYDEFKKDILAPLKKCIIITINSPVQKPFCNYSNIQDCISISLHEYSLNRPEILKKVIEVAKKPCTFFPNVENYSEAIRIHYNKYKPYYDTEESYLKGHLRNYNQNLRTLQCDKPVGSRKLETIILNFIDANKQRQFQMIVKREE